MKANITKNRLGLISGLLTVVIVASCSGSSFESDNNGGGGGGVKPRESGNPQPTGGIDSNPTLGTNPNGGTSVPNGGPNSGGPDLSGLNGLSTTCASTAAYNPVNIQCNIRVGDTSNGWYANHAGSWKAPMDRFVDKSANWISPLAAIAESPGHMICPSIPNNEKLIYVSYFDIAVPGSYHVENLADDAGSAQFWKDTDPAKVVSTFQIPIFASTNVNLEAGRYAVILDATDTGTASGTAFSIQGPGGQVIKNSANDGSWCIFRTTKGENTAAFVNANAGCLPCMGRK